MLIIAPPAASTTLQKVAASLEGKGRRVRTLPVERFRAAPPSIPHAVDDHSPHQEPVSSRLRVGLTG